MPALPERIAHIAGASPDISYLTDHSSWREKVAAAEGGASHQSSSVSAMSETYSRGAPTGRSGALISGLPKALAEQPVDASDRHGWYMSVFDKPLPAGRRDAVLVARWLDFLDAQDAAAEAVPAHADAAATDEPSSGEGGADGAEIATNWVTIASPPMSRERVGQYSAAFEELVRQVSVMCIERGQVLTRIWQRLSSSMTGFLECEAQLRRELGKMSAEHAKEVACVQRLAQERGELKQRLSSIEANSKWSAAAVRMRRYHDTIKWRAALSMTIKEKESLAAQLEEIRKANADAGFRALIAQIEGEGEANAPCITAPPSEPPSPPKSKRAAQVAEAQVDFAIDYSLKKLPTGDADTMEQGVAAIAKAVAPSLQAVKLVSMAAVGLSEDQKRKIAEREAQDKVVDKLLNAALNEIDDDLALSRQDLAAANRDVHEVAQMAMDLKEKTEQLASLRAQQRAARDEIDALMQRLAEEEARRAAAEEARAKEEAARLAAQAAEKEALEAQRRAEEELAGAEEAQEAAQDAARQAEEMALRVRAQRRESVMPARRGSSMTPSPEASPPPLRVIKAHRGTQTDDEAPKKTVSATQAPAASPVEEVQPTFAVYKPRARRMALNYDQKVGLMPLRQTVKTLREYLDARSLSAQDDPSHLGTGFVESVEDYFSASYGLVELGQKHGSKFLSSLARCAKDSAVLGLFARLAGLPGHKDLSHSTVALNISMEAIRAFAYMGLDPTDANSEVTRDQFVELLQAVTIDAVIEVIDVDAVWRGLCAASGVSDEVLRLHSALLIQRCARMMLEADRLRKEHAAAVGEDGDTSQITLQRVATRLHAVEARSAHKKAQEEHTHNKKAYRTRRQAGGMAVEGEELVLVGHVLAYVAEELSRLEAPLFRRLVAPALAAADVNRDGMLGRTEVGALVRALNSKASEKAIARVWYDLHVAANSAEIQELNDAVVSVSDADSVAEVMRRGSLRQLVQHCTIAEDSPLFASTNVLVPAPIKRTLLPLAGSAGLAKIEEEWAAEAGEQARAAVTKPGAPPGLRDALAERVEAFDSMLERTRAAITRPGGGDEKVVATLAFALHMVRAEASSILGGDAVPMKKRGKSSMSLARGKSGVR